MRMPGRGFVQCSRNEGKEGFVEMIIKRLGYMLLLVAATSQSGFAQKALTWGEVRARFESSNPSLQAAQINVDESRADEITANLRPNPGMTLSFDQVDPFTANPYRPFTYSLPLGSVNYLKERQNKRGLRLESAKKATGITVSQQSDLERNLLFNLRSAFVQTLQGKAVLDLARENLSYYDHVLEVNRERYRAGGIAQVDLDRLELQRVLYESDLQTAEVNLCTAK